MVITSDLHTHTTHSHGSGSIEDNVKSAIEKGLKKIAISDHGFSHPFYGIKDKERYIADIETVKQKYRDRIDVLSNVELNLTSREGDLDLPQGLEGRFDMLMFAYHKMAGYFRLKDFFYFTGPFSKTKRAAIKNTEAYIKALEKYDINIITHPGYGLPIDILEVAKAAKDRGAALEISDKHTELTPAQLAKTASTGVMFAVSSDAHSPNDVGCFSRALKKIEEAGIPASQIINAED